MPHATTDDGVKLYYEEAGAGAAMVFVHEFAGDHRSWEPQMRHFSRRYRCVAYNARGYPPSDVPADQSKYSQDRARLDILAMVDHFGAQKAHICGLSMGGFATLHFGVHHADRARSLVVAGCGYGAEPEQREKFRRYVQSWQRPAAEDDAYDFRFWDGEADPPSHSVPAQLVAKAAARVGEDAFRRVHERLLRAYFHENRDISHTDTLRSLWSELELPAERFDERDDPELLRAVVNDHQEALELGATGVPAVRLVGNDAVIVGAHPVELYRRWIQRAEAQRSEASAGAAS